MLSAATRRQFLMTTGQLAAVAAAGFARADTEGKVKDKGKPKAEKKRSDNPVRCAVVGVHGRGMDHIKGLLDADSNAVITTVCDCDKGVIEKAMKLITERQGAAPKFVQDMRQVFDDPAIEAVTFATPNHWHALGSIWAMQAGKDVYVEKPVSHNVSEGRRLVEAARKFNRICQAGTQIRSMPGIREAMAYIHAGKLGDVKLARGTCYKSRKSIGKHDGPAAVPTTMDFNLWCGPAPMVAPVRDKLHYDWHWNWATGNGDFGNQGIHQADVARWGLNKAVHPSRVFSVGGRFGYVDDGETPNTQVCLFDYGDAQMIFEVRGLETDDLLADVRHKKTESKPMQCRVGNVFYGKDGYLICSSYTNAIALDYDNKVLKVFGGSAETAHYANFTAAVRSRKAADLHGEIMEGHLSSALCHLGNISYRLGQDRPFGSMEIPKSDPLAEAVERAKKHLTANTVALDAAACRVGAVLAFDPQTETFGNNKAADAMLTREYRKGFEVPAKV